MDMENECLGKIVKHILEKHDCHTVILYGSRARNQANQNSDYDIIGIKDEGTFERDCRVIDDAYLDAFIYPLNLVQNPDNYFIRVKDGIVLVQKDNVGNALLDKIKLIYDAGPPKMPAWEVQEICVWLQKMAARSRDTDIEGDFRRQWLLHDILECYFKLRDLWYLGPKEGFLWIKNNDYSSYEAFARALKQTATSDDIQNLVNRVIDIK